MAPEVSAPIEQPTLFSLPSACLAEASETSPGHHTEPPPSHPQISLRVACLLCSANTAIDPSTHTHTDTHTHTHTHRGGERQEGRGMVKENPEENKEIYSTDSFSVKKKIYCIQIGL